jgi:hypothetical protein
MSGRARCCGILLFLLAIGIPKPDQAQEAAKGSAVSQPPADPAQAPKTPKEPTGKASTEISKAGAITDVKVEPESSRLVVTVMTDRLLAPNAFQVENPPRLVLDFPNTENRVQFSRLRVNAASVRRLRVQQFQGLPHMIARVVFDLEEDFVSHEITVDKTFVRIVFSPGPSKSGSVQDAPDSKSVDSQPESRNALQPEAAKATPAVGDPQPTSAGFPVKVAMPSIPQAAVQPVRILPRAASRRKLSVKAPQPRRLWWLPWYLPPFQCRPNPCSPPIPGIQVNL